MAPHIVRLIAAAAIATVVVGACDTANPVGSAPGLGSTAQPGSAAPDSSATPNAEFEALVARSAAFRRDFGLRAEDAWVRQVAADPTARWNYQVPLTAAEEAQLDARAAALAELGPVLEGYGARQASEFAGMYVDQERGGLLVVLFTANLEEHGRAIAQLVRPGAPVELRLAPASQADLHGLMEQIANDQALAGLGVFVLETSADEVRGVVEVGVSTEREDAQGVIASRHGPAVHVIVLDPTGAFLKPRGTIIGRVVDESGAGIRAFVGSEPLFGEFGMDSVGPPETNPDGTFRLANQLPGRWRLTAFAEGFMDGSAELEVPPGGVVTVEIELQPS
jgi:hypothetical protein